MLIPCVGAGCVLLPKSHPPASPPPAVDSSPPLSTSVDHYFGTPLSGSQAAPSPAPSFDDAPVVTVTFVALEKMPSDALQPLISHARLVVTSRGGIPVLATGQLTQAARYGPVSGGAQAVGAAAGAQTPIATLHGLLPAGATVSFTAADRSANAVAAGFLPGGQRLEVGVCRPPARPAAAATTAATTAPAYDEGLQIGLLQQRLTSNVASAAGFGDIATELALVNLPPASAPARVAFIVPFTVAGAPAAKADGASAGSLPRSTGAIAIVVEIAAATRNPMNELLQIACDADLKRSSAAAAARPQTPVLGSAEPPGLSGALDSLNSGGDRRASLVYLAHATGAGTCEDVALVADDAVLTRLANAVLLKKNQSNVAPQPASMRWMLDGAAWQTLVDLGNASKLSPELASVATLHAGEAGRHPDAISEAIANATGPEQVDARLTAENYIYLEDSSPATRVRAFDWLRGRGNAPQGYDPMAPAKQRRAALEKSLSAAAAPTTAPRTTASPTTASAPNDSASR